MKALMIATVLLPLLLVPVALLLPRKRGLMVLPLAPLPALVLAACFSDGELALPGLLLGGLWGLDELRRIFLLLTALVWLVAGIQAIGYMRSERVRSFVLFWLLTLSGNLGLVLAADIAGFYSFFALMTFSAYGLVVHVGTQEARRAGRIYLIMAVLGEGLLLAGLLLGARAADSLLLADLGPAIADSTRATLIAALLWLGFGVKAGLPLLHFWLPLAHPVAPTPASAVLSGAMIKAGLLGWLLTLPLGLTDAPQQAGVVIVAGGVAALGAGLIGLCQQRAKTVLAYSSISQMGLITLLLGAALSHRSQAAALVSVLALYALHHGLAKASLFLATGLRRPSHSWSRRLGWVLVALPGLALAGLPFTSGAAAKLAAKQALVADLDVGLLAWVAPLMSAGSVATLLLVWRYLECLAREREAGSQPASVTAGWLAAVALSLVLFWWLPWTDLLAGEAVTAFLFPDADRMLGLAWPVLLAVALALLARMAGFRGREVAAGDLVVGLERAASRLRLLLVRMARVRSTPMPRSWHDRARRLALWIEETETMIGRESGLLFLLVLVLMVLALGGRAALA